MQTSTVMGIAVGVATLVGGMILKGANPIALVNPAALVIIFVGTTAALLNSFSLPNFVKLGTMFRLLFAGQKLPSKLDIAKEFISLSYTARKDGLLALEKIQFENPFMQFGISMVVDGVEEEVISDVLESQLEALEARHKVGSTLFAQAGMYAPTLGVLGAVIGLVAALGNLNDIEALGHSIAAAFVATLFGIFTGYVLWHPFSNKLKQMSREEIEIKRMMMEGIIAIHAGSSPRIIQMKMLAYIPDGQKSAVLEELENHG